MYEVLQHADDLGRYFVRNKQTGRHVIEHCSFKQALDTANALEFTRLVQQSQQAVADEWPRELDIDTPTTERDK